VHRTGQLYGHFETLEQQKESAALGMWVFLVTEVCSSAACSSLTPSIVVRSARPSAPEATLWISSSAALTPSC